MKRKYARNTGRTSFCEGTDEGVGEYREQGLRPSVYTDTVPPCFSLSYRDPYGWWQKSRQTGERTLYAASAGALRQRRMGACAVAKVINVRMVRIVLHFDQRLNRSLTRLYRMLLRRLVALVSAVTMLHLSVGAADAACAGKGGSNHLAGAHSVSEHSSHARHAGRPAPGIDASTSRHAMNFHSTAATPTSGSTGGLPVQSRCCESMTTCSVSGTVAQRVAIVATLPAACVVLTAGTEAVSSAPQAPEPPPPKA